jgi:hypothetical protein
MTCEGELLVVITYDYWYRPKWQVIDRSGNIILDKLKTMEEAREALNQHLKKGELDEVT